MNLDERKKKILTSVVEGYIESAEPIGSKTIAEKYNLEFSSATIRNDMKLLEENGYLTQPHTSAGRVPSNKGYRYYVDNLMKNKTLSMIDIDYINNSINSFGDTEDLLNQVSDTVSKILKRPTLLTMKDEDTIANIKVLKISKNIILIVLLSANGRVKDVITKLTDTIDDNKINELSRLLDYNLKGTKIEQLHIVLSSLIAKELKEFSNILEKICDELRKEINSEEKLVSKNIEAVLELPEFNDIEKARKFINMLSTNQILKEAIPKIKNKEVGIVIGNENEELLLKDCSIISLNLPLKNGNYELSVLSPTRLDYSKTVTTLKYINDRVKDIFSKEKVDNKGGAKFE